MEANTTRKRTDPLRTVTITGACDDGAKDRGCDTSAIRRGVDSARRRDEGAQRAVEAPLAVEGAMPLSGQGSMDSRPTMFERSQRRGRGQLTAADRESQAVAGHRIDESRRVAGQQQTVDCRGTNVNGQRSEHGWRCREAGAGEALAKWRIACEFPGQECGRIAEGGVAG